MFKIVRVPSQLESFFDSLSGCFHWDHFYYFRILVLVIGFAWGRRNVSALYRYPCLLRDVRQVDMREGPHRTRFNNFFLVGRWDPEVALQQKAQEMLAFLQPRPGEQIYLITCLLQAGRRFQERQTRT